MSMLSAIRSKVKNPLLQRMVVYAFSEGVSKAMPFLVFPIVAYYLTQEEFGLVANFSVLTAVLAPFVGLSTYSALSVDYYKKPKEELPAFYANLLYTNLLLFLLVLIIVLLLTKVIEQWTGYSLGWQLLAMISLFFAPFVSLFSTRLRLEEKAKKFGQFQILSSTIGALLTFVFIAVFLWSWKGRIYSLVFSSVLPGLIALYYTIRFLGNKLPKIDLTIVKSTILFGLPLLPHNLSFWLKSGFEKLLVTGTQGLAENGIMSFAQTVSSIFVLITTAFFGAYSPYLFKRLANLSSENYADKLDLVKKSYLFLLAYLVVLLLGYFLIRVGVEVFFFKYHDSLEYLIYFLGFNFFNACYAIFSGYIFYTKSTKFLGLITITTAFLQVGLSVLLVNLYGGIGAAYSTLIISVLTALSVGIFSNRKYPMPWFYFLKR